MIIFINQVGSLTCHKLSLLKKQSASSLIKAEERSGNTGSLPFSWSWFRLFWHVQYVLQLEICLIYFGWISCTSLHEFISNSWRFLIQSVKLIQDHEDLIPPLGLLWQSPTDPSCNSSSGCPSRGHISLRQITCLMDQCHLSGVWSLCRPPLYPRAGKAAITRMEITPNTHTHSHIERQWVSGLRRHVSVTKQNKRWLQLKFHMSSLINVPVIFC